MMLCCIRRPPVLFPMVVDDEFNFYRATHAKCNILSALPTVTPLAEFNLDRNNGWNFWHTDAWLSGLILISIAKGWRELTTISLYLKSVSLYTTGDRYRPKLHLDRVHGSCDYINAVYLDVSRSMIIHAHWTYNFICTSSRFLRLCWYHVKYIELAYTCICM